MENGGLEDDNLVSKGAIFHFHDYGRKGSLPTTIFQGRCVSFRVFFKGLTCFTNKKKQPKKLEVWKICDRVWCCDWRKLGNCQILPEIALKRSTNCGTESAGPKKPSHWPFTSSLFLDHRPWDKSRDLSVMDQKQILWIWQGNQVLPASGTFLVYIFKRSLCY